jgi:hypothetical protein
MGYSAQRIRLVTSKQQDRLAARTKRAEQGQIEVEDDQLAPSSTAPLNKVFTCSISSVSTYVVQLIGRRKVYPADLRDVLMRAQALRDTVDYQRAYVTRTQMAPLLRRGRTCVEALRAREGGAE